MGVSSKSQAWAGCQGGCLHFSLFQSPQGPCEGTSEPWGHENNVLSRGWCAPVTHPHLVFWRVDTSLLSEESLFFTIQKVIIKKATLICRKPTGILTTLHIWKTFLLVHPAPNLAGKKLLCFITVLEKQTKHPLNQAHVCPVTSVTTLIQFAWKFKILALKALCLRKHLIPGFTMGIPTSWEPLTSPGPTGMIAHPACHPSDTPGLWTALSWAGGLLWCLHYSQRRWCRWDQRRSIWILCLCEASI